MHTYMIEFVPDHCYFFLSRQAVFVTTTGLLLRRVNIAFFFMALAKFI